MVIKRLQSVYLLLASLMMGFFSFIPFASQNGNDVSPNDLPVYMIINLLIAVLLFISIFLFKNITRQKMLVKVTTFLIIASAITGAIICYNTSNIQILWHEGPLMLICSLLVTFAAYRRICHDDKLLKAADRIR